MSRKRLSNQSRGTTKRLWRTPQAQEAGARVETLFTKDGEPAKVGERAYRKQPDGRMVLQSQTLNQQVLYRTPSGTVTEAKSSVLKLFGRTPEDPQSWISRPNSGRHGIDIISGGFPCQPHSVAGKRKGSGDERDLWPEFRRIVGLFKPEWVVAENVPGLFSSDAGRFFGAILADLAALGYSVGWCTYGAVDVGAWHRRDRVFIVAHSDSRRNTQSGLLKSSLFAESGQDVPDTAEPRLEGAEPAGAVCAGGLPPKCGSVSDTKRNGLEESGDGGVSEGSRDTVTNASWWSVEPPVGRVANGVPRRVDRIKALGNAVVPQQIYPIYKAIVEVSNTLGGTP